MGYALLWVENLAVALLFAALVMAAGARIQRGWLRRGFITLCTIIPLMLYLGLVSLAGWLYFGKVTSLGQFPALVLIAFAYLLGAMSLLRRGLRRSTDQTPVAASWSGGKIAIALLGAIVLNIVTFGNLDSAARQQLAAIRNEASVMALADAPVAVPDYDNAAVTYRQASEAMGNPYWDLIGWKWGKKWEAIWRAQLDKSRESGKFDFDPHDAELRRFLQRQSQTLALLHKAAAKPGCNFGHDYAHPSPSMTLPEWGYLYKAAMILSLDATCRIADGDHCGAIRDINSMFHLAENACSDPLMVCLSGAIRFDHFSLVALQGLVASDSVRDQDLANVDFTAMPSYFALFQRALRLHRAFNLAGLVEIAQTPEKVAGGLRSYYEREPPWIHFLSRCATPLYRVFLLADDLVAQSRISEESASIVMDGGWYRRNLTWLHKCDEHMRNDASRAALWVLSPTVSEMRFDQRYSLTPPPCPYEDRDRVSDWQRRVQRLESEPSGILAASSGMPLTMYFDEVTRGYAERSVARLGVAACGYRAKHGHLPAKLDDLVPEFFPSVPVDPYDGDPMRMKRTRHGLVIYSIGPDLYDGDGTPFDWQKKTGDITFEVSDKTRPTVRKQTRK